MREATHSKQPNWAVFAISFALLSIGFLSGCAEDKGGGGVVAVAPQAVPQCSAGQVQYNGLCLQQDNRCGVNGAIYNNQCVQGILTAHNVSHTNVQSAFQSPTAYVGTISVVNRGLYARYLANSGRCQESAIQPVQTGWPGVWPTTSVSIAVGGTRCHFYTSGGAIAIDFGDTRSLGFGAIPSSVQVSVASGSAVGGQVDWRHTMVTGGAIIPTQGQMSVSARNSNSNTPSFVAVATTGHPYAVGAFEIESSPVSLRDATQFNVVMRFSGQVFATATVTRQVGSFNQPPQWGTPGVIPTYPPAWHPWPQPRYPQPGVWW